MKKNNISFLITSNENSAKSLIDRGYTLVYQTSNIWQFAVNNKLNFSDLENVKVTNKLFL